MNGKRLLILAAFAAFASIVMPAAFAGTISNQGNITVKWDTLAVGSMALVSNYSATGAQGNGAPAIVQTQNTGTGTCTTNGVGSEANATVNFGNVTADASTHYTDCQYRNAALATVVSSDPSWTVTTQNITGALPANYAICLLENGSANSAGGTAWAINGAVFQDNTGAATAVTTSTCPTTNGFSVGSTTAATAFTGTATTTGTNLGADYILVIPPGGVLGNQLFNVQYTLTLN